MKVAAIIDDNLIQEAIKYSGAKNITEALRIALKEYVAVYRLKEMSKEIVKEPLQFSLSAKEIRNVNRR